MPQREALRRMIGHDVAVDDRTGRHHHGRLLNVNRRSVWLLEGDEDCFIPLADVTDLRLSG